MDSMKRANVKRTFRSLVVGAGAGILGLALGAASAQAGACTWGQGYWGTHSAYGPSPYDPTWASVGEDTPFFRSGKTYYRVMVTKPRQDHQYYLLAKQYISAVLNVHQGAEMSAEVLGVMLDAQNLFESYGLNYDYKHDPDGVVGEFLEMAAILRGYNAGKLGPGHCAR
jgi:hypothetical protein